MHLKSVIWLIIGSTVVYTVEALVYAVSSVNRTLGLVPLENQCKEARGRANTIQT
jgi:hypothetical protein